MKYIGNITYDKRLKENIAIVIYGAGENGKKMVHFLENIDQKKNIKCICDKNQKLWHTKMNGIEIVSPEEASVRFGEADYLISGKYAVEMKRELDVLNIERIHMILI